MHRTILAVSMVAVCFLPLTSLAAQPTARPGSISGRVYRSDSAAARFAEVSVSLRLADEKLEAEKRLVTEVKTDSAGRYSFATVAPGMYTVAARVVFKTDLEAPCPVVSTGLTLFPETNAAGWSVHMIRTNIGVIEGIFSEPFSVEAGQALKKDIDLKCK